MNYRSLWLLGLLLGAVGTFGGETAENRTAAEGANSDPHLMAPSLVNKLEPSIKPKQSKKADKAGSSCTCTCHSKRNCQVHSDIQYGHDDPLQNIERQQGELELQTLQPLDQHGQYDQRGQYRVDEPQYVRPSLSKHNAKKLYRAGIGANDQLGQLEPLNHEGFQQDQPSGRFGTSPTLFDTSTQTAKAADLSALNKPFPPLGGLQSILGDNVGERANILNSTTSKQPLVIPLVRTNLYSENNPASPHEIRTTESPTILTAVRPTTIVPTVQPIVVPSVKPAKPASKLILLVSPPHPLQTKRTPTREALKHCNELLAKSNLEAMSRAKSFDFKQRIKVPSLQKALQADKKFFRVPAAPLSHIGRSIEPHSSCSDDTNV